MSSSLPTGDKTDGTTPSPTRTAGGTHLATGVLGALLALGVSVIHVMDQGGLTDLRDPDYLGYAYWALELAGVICAVLLLTGRRSAGWLLAVGVAAGPLAGYIVTRTVGLPDATDDIGNWGEPLGVVSLIVEAVLLILAVMMLARSRRAG